MLVKNIVKSGKDYYIKHLDIISTFKDVPLTKIEREILATLMLMCEGEEQSDLLSSENMLKVRKELRLSSPSLSNHIKSLIIKGYIYRDELNKKMFKGVVPKLEGNEYLIRLHRDNGIRD